MNKRLIALDIKILQALGEVGPRNLSEVARAVGVPRATLRFRINRMINHPKVSLKCHATVYYPFIGMKKATVIAKASPGKEQLLFDCMKVNDFWTHIVRSYGEGEGCLGSYIIPIEHTEEFEEFLQTIKKMGVAEEISIYWSTCFKPGKIIPEWFNEKTLSWDLHWEKWLSEMEKADTELPSALIDPEKFSNYADEIDVFILGELEKDALQHLQNIARKLSVSLQRARYHYEKHLVEKKLLEDFEISICPYDPEGSDEVLFIIEFHNQGYLAKFANSLLNKHFVRAVGKVLDEAILIIPMNLPRKELRSFIDVLSDLTRKKTVKNYRYVIIDPRHYSRQTLPYRLFKRAKWTYEHQKYLRTLEELLQKSYG
jgi:DNA-binding Lrp family transcriptional regulator